MQKMKILLLLCVLPNFIFAQSTLQIGDSLLKKRDYKAAKTQFENVLKEDPDNKKAIEGLGDIAVYSENWDAALERFKKLVAEEPENANYNFKYGGTLALKAKNISRMKAFFYISDIKKYLKKAARLDSKHIETRWGLVELYLVLPGIVGGSANTAKKYADQIIKIDTLNGYLAKARIAEAEGNKNMETSYYKKALRLDFSDKCEAKLKAIGEKLEQSKGDVLQGLCTTYLKNHLNYQIGKACAETGLQARRGILYMKRYMKAYTAVDGVPPKWSYLRMAQLYKNLGLKDKADYWIEKSLAIDDDFERAENENEKIAQM